jgi:hypothetical protein
MGGGRILMVETKQALGLRVQGLDSECKTFDRIENNLED